MLNTIIQFFLERKIVTAILTTVLILWGIATAPFSWNISWLPSDPVPVDAIPDIGENQQIVYAEWPGRSPQDMEDQVTYPLTTALLGMPGVKTIRSNSIFGLSSIYIIFEDDVEFYWSRSRILEKLNSLPRGTLPAEVQPSLGPDATALGQIYWYTLEGRDQNGNPAGGWDPQELRSIQDFYVKYALASAEGVAEVASIGGFVKEYQVDIDPVAMRGYEIHIGQVMMAVKKSNLDVGARTLEINKAEYLVRGLGYIEELEDLEETVVSVRNNVPIRIKDVARVQLGPAMRRGGLDKAGAEAVGAVVVARYGSNPLEVINNLKDKIRELEPGLPSKTLSDGSTSKVTIIPFYDRTGLINETLGTLEEALTLEVLISIMVVIILVLNLRASFIISSLLPIGVLVTFILMKYAGVAANIVALSGIAIAIGVMVDVGVVFTENIMRHLQLPENQNISKAQKLKVVYQATTEVASAVVTALATTVVSFLPVFALQAQEGKLFKPLAYTKSFALLAALLVGIVVIPAISHWIFSAKLGSERTKRMWNVALCIFGAVIAFWQFWLGILLVLVAANNLLAFKWRDRNNKIQNYINVILALAAVSFLLTKEWLPLGAGNSGFSNFSFVVILVAIVVGSLWLVTRYYQPMLRWCLDHRWQFLSLPVIVLSFGILSWLGFSRTFSFVSVGAKSIGWNIERSSTWQLLSDRFPGLGSEFMPPLDEGSFLLMPTTMPHSGVSENMEIIQLLDQRVTAIPEVELTVGKWGRVASALDPAPISMFENTINYKPEYILDADGQRMRFKVNGNGEFVLNDGTVFNTRVMDLHLLDVDMLVPDANGRYFRQWRSHIQSADDIWNEIVKTTNLPGLTSAPKLQPIATRLVMLSTGMRAPLGIKVYGPDLQTIENVGLRLERHLRNVPGVKPSSVFADRVVGKPYLEIDIDRKAIARYGLNIQDMQNYLAVAIGGSTLTTTVEGRERYPVRVRYARELRDNPDDLRNILIPTATSAQVPLSELASITYTRGPQNIRGENTFLVGYVIFDKLPGFAEVEVIENARLHLDNMLSSGELAIPSSVNFEFAGNYENQVRATKRLSIVIPISLVVIFLILYFQFGNVQSSLMVFSGVVLAFAGGFILLWLYGQPWFLHFNLFGENIRDLFNIGTINLSVAVWVGFIALFGVASDNGVLMATLLKQTFARSNPTEKLKVREAVIQAGLLRIRPAMMTTATTLIALLPIFTSTGKGSDIMGPMAIPTFGGMLIQVLSVFLVPVLYCMWQESKLKKAKNEK